MQVIFMHTVTAYVGNTVIILINVYKYYRNNIRS